MNDTNKTKPKLLLLLLLSAPAFAAEGPDDEGPLLEAVEDADEIESDKLSGAITFEDDGDDVDVNPELDAEGRYRTGARRTLPDPYEALHLLSREVERFAALSVEDHGRELVLVLDQLAQVEAGRSSLPQELCTAGAGSLLQFLDDDLQLSRDASEDSPALATKAALADVCEQIPSYWMEGKGSLEMQDSVAFAPEVSWDTKFPEELCARPVVVVPGLPPAVEHFELGGYMLSGDTVTLEEGQRITAKGCGTKPRDDGYPGYTEYGLQLTYTYRNYTETQVFDFVEQSAAGVPLPDKAFLLPDQRGFTHGTLTWQVARRDCWIDCSAPKLLGSKTTVPLKMAARGRMCSATFKQNQFQINDRNDVDPKHRWRSSKVTALTGLGVVGDNPTFRALARVPKKQADNTEDSSFPFFENISGSARFALHADDTPISIYDATHSREQIIEQMGTAELSALRFPRVTGTNPNTKKPYSYSCKPPSLVRDFVAFCSESPDLAEVDSFYLLPFKGTSQVYAGNQASAVPGAPHTKETEYFAYDFVTKWMDDQTMYAARSGVVIKVDDTHDGGTWVFSPPCMTDDADNPGFMKPTPSCPQNETIVLHQDGTTAVYMHGTHHGSVVSVGDVVERGQALGQSGCVGNCGEDHIHFDVHDTFLNPKLRNGVHVPRSWQPKRTDETHYSIPSSFDRWTKYCNVPGTATQPTGTLSDGFPTDEGGPVYYQQVENDENLPVKRKVAQIVPPAHELFPGNTIHTTEDTASKTLTVEFDPLIPGPFTTTWTYQGNTVTKPGLSKNIVLTNLPHGFKTWGVSVKVVDGNGNARNVSTSITTYRGTLDEYKDCEAKPWMPECNPNP